MANAIIQDVTDTAFWVAVYRATETEKERPLFRDPYAKSLVGDRGRDIARQMSRARYVEWSVIIRTCIIDDYIRELVRDGVDMIINLGCGLDTRPYRLDLPSSLRWVEIDFPKTIDFKEKQLAQHQPRCRLERIGLDLNQDEKRAEVFSKLNREATRAAVLTEGVIPYLTEEQVSSLAQALRKNDHFRYWIIEYYSPDVIRHMNSAVRKRQMKNSPFVFSPADWFGFFKQNSWNMSEIRYLAEESERLGREVPMPIWARILRKIFPRSAEKRGYRKFTGYAVLR